MSGIEALVLVGITIIGLVAFGFFTVELVEIDERMTRASYSSKMTRSSQAKAVKKCAMRAMCYGAVVLFAMISGFAYLFHLA